MLRITVLDEPERTVLRLEGKLKGAWVKELERVWYGLHSQPEPKTLRLDLSGVSFVDQRGKGVLALLQREKVELFAVGPLMTSVVDEISHPGPELVRAGNSEVLPKQPIVNSLPSR